jgi:hypothetical protein
MHTVRRYLKDKKGINTILASLLMVVIVVVASVMVYAWSTGLLGTLLVQPNVGKEALGMDSFSFLSNNTNVTIYVRNSGTVAVSFATYYVKDNSGNSWQLQNWAPANQPVSVNGVIVVNLGIGSGCAPSTCQYTGTAAAFNTFASGSYNVLLVTTRNNQFAFQVVK